MNQNPWMLVNASGFSFRCSIPNQKGEEVPCLFRTPLINPRVVSKVCCFCHIMDSSTTVNKSEFLVHGLTGWILLLFFPPQQ